MKPVNVLITTLLMFNTAWAAPSKQSRTESGASCFDCYGRGKSSNDSLNKFVKEMNNITDGALDIEFISDKMNYANKCENFAADGDMNGWGEVIMRELSKDKYSTLVKRGPGDIQQYCPNYKNMNTADKKALNVLVLTAMTHYESSCDFREKAPGPNGTAAGLLQLHKGQEHKYSDGCRAGDSSSAERSLVCGLSMLNDQIERDNKLFSSSSYWEVLRPRGRSQKAKLIQSAIRKFSACSPGSVAKRNQLKGARIAKN